MDKPTRIDIAETDAADEGEAPPQRAPTPGADPTPSPTDALRPPGAMAKAESLNPDNTGPDENYRDENYRDEKGLAGPTAMTPGQVSGSAPSSAPGSAPDAIFLDPVGIMLLAAGGLGMVLVGIPLLLLALFG